MVPGAIEPELFGMTLSEVFEMHQEEYCARVLASICEAALQHHRSSGALLINYEQLPDAVWTEVAGFFGTPVSDSDRESVRRVTQLDGKDPEFGFDGDSHAKKNKASEAVLVATERWLAPIYEQTTRLGGSEA